MKRARHRNLPSSGKISKDKQRVLPIIYHFFIIIIYFFLIGWLLSPRNDRLKVYFPFFTVQKYTYFFPFMNSSINLLVLGLTLIVVLDPRLFILMLSGISALCCSQQR